MGNVNASLTDVLHYTLPLQTVREEARCLNCSSKENCAYFHLDHNDHLNLPYNFFWQCCFAATEMWALLYQLLPKGMVLTPMELVERLFKSNRNFSGSKDLQRLLPDILGVSACLAMFTFDSPCNNYEYVEWEEKGGFTPHKWGDKTSTKFNFQRMTGYHLYEVYMAKFW